MAKTESVSREYLFDLVWSKPATQVARDLGVSDTAVKKLCQKLQVPKPPRGYWRRVETGEEPRRPPLPAMLEQATRESAGGRAKSNGTYLSPRRRELFLSAADSVGYSASAQPFSLRNGYLTTVEPQFAAAVILAAKRECVRLQFAPNPSAQQSIAAERTTHELIERLLPFAGDVVAVFEEAGRSPRRVRSPAVIVRLTRELQQEIGTMAELVRTHHLEHVARSLHVCEHVPRFHVAGSPLHGRLGTVRLHVSTSSLWVEAFMYAWFDDGADSRPSFVSESLPLYQFIPEDLAAARSVELPPAMPQGRLSSNHERAAQRLAQAEDMYDTFVAGGYATSDLLASAREREPGLALWMGEEERRTVQAGLDVFGAIDEQVEYWEQRIEFARQRMVQKIFGIRPGDVVCSRNRRGLIKVLASTITGGVHDDCFLAIIHGKRFRKDGTLGKRDDTVYVKVRLSGGKSDA